MLLETAVPEITTERLRLRCPKEEDGDAYVRFFSDKEASHFYGGPLSELSAWKVLGYALGHWHLRGFGMWSVETVEDNSFVGACGLVAPRGWPRPELTWWITPEHRRQGFAQEASRAVIAFGYDTLKWDMVETHMNDDNEAARKLVVSLGGEIVARELFPDGLSRNIYKLPKV